MIFLSFLDHSSDPTPTPILRTSVTSFSFMNCSDWSGHVTIGTPAATASSIEFHPQCVMNPPVASWSRISTCGAHPLMIRPFPSILFSNSGYAPEADVENRIRFSTFEPAQAFMSINCCCSISSLCFVESSIVVA